MTGKILIKTIPITEERIAARRIDQPDGEPAPIEDGRQFRHLTLHTAKVEGGPRGGHYHPEKLEYPYLARG